MFVVIIVSCRYIVIIILVYMIDRCAAYHCQLHILTLMNHDHSNHIPTQSIIINFAIKRANDFESFGAGSEIVKFYGFKTSCALLLILSFGSRAKILFEILDQLEKVSKGNKPQNFPRKLLLLDFFNYKEFGGVLPFSVS